MWIMTSLGFFSVVQKSGDAEKDTLTIRARARADLEALRQNYLPELGSIVTNGETDYRYRAQAPPPKVGAAFQALVADIGYGNFKNEVQLRQGKGRAHVYNKVWNALWEIEEPSTAQALSAKSSRL